MKGIKVVLLLLFIPSAVLASLFDMQEKISTVPPEATVSNSASRYILGESYTTIPTTTKKKYTTVVSSTTKSTTVTSSTTKSTPVISPSDVSRSAKPVVESANYINITKDFTNTIVEILQKFDDMTLKNSYEDWHSYAFQNNRIIDKQISQYEKMQILFNKIHPKDTPTSHSDSIFCSFYILQVDTKLNYEKLAVEGEFFYEYKTTTNGSISIVNSFIVHIKNSNFSVTLSTEPGALSLFPLADITNEEITILITSPSPKINRLEREKRRYLGQQISSSLIEWIEDKIKNAGIIPIFSMSQMCKEPLKLIKTNYPNFAAGLTENKYIVAIGSNWTDNSTSVYQTQIIIKGLWNINNIEVWHRDPLNNASIYKLRINLKGYVTWTQNSKNPIEVNFKIDHISLTVNKTRNKINNVQIKAGKSSVLSNSPNSSPPNLAQQTDIIKNFESLTASFLHKEFQSISQPNEN